MNDCHACHEDRAKARQQCAGGSPARHAGRGGHRPGRPAKARSPSTWFPARQLSHPLADESTRATRRLNLLETSYLLVRLPAYAVNRTKRLIKAPKIYCGDTGDKLLPIEVKATSRPRLGDAAHLRTFRQEYGKKSRAGLLLHTGSALEWLAPDVLAAPWWKVL